MAARTWSEKPVVELFPAFLTKLSRTYGDRFESVANDVAGVPAATIAILGDGISLAESGIVTRERFRWRSPYATKDNVTPQWERAVAAGLAEAADGGWRVTPKGREARERATGEFRSFLGKLSLPPQPLGRALQALERLASTIPSGSLRVEAARRLPPPAPASEIVRLQYAVRQLWARRDDCHTGAWQDAGYAGPELDVLTQVWSGKSSADEVAKTLEHKQERIDALRNVEALVGRGDLGREGDVLRCTPQGRASRDEIEAETDRRYFVGWPKRDELALIADDLTAVMEALPGS
ncbi:MAG: hypothetical protein M3O91_06990 [Chloroflexota bacterium]|nr:hypothetical protein [Chloroflexota bacterium]